MKRKLCITAASVIAAALMRPDAFAAPFSYGDIFASVNNGQVRHYSSSGVLLQTLDTGLGGITGGLGFDQEGNLYVANHSRNSITRCG